MLYLDNNATTKVHPEVIDVMRSYFDTVYGNPDGKYYDVAEQSKQAVNYSRLQISNILKCQSDEVIFTSGATESNNMIIKGVAYKNSTKGRHLITSTIEHSSVYETFKFLETKGFEVTYLPVNKEGQLDYDLLQKSIRPDTILVSLMWVNNELGSIFDIEKISNICLKSKVDFHSDATQAIGKVKVDLSHYPGLTHVSFSGHKIYGPKGIGVAIIKKDELGLPRKIEKLLHGGEQEHNYRAGTLNVPGIVGVAKALEIVTNEFDLNYKKLVVLEQEILRLLNKLFDNFMTLNNRFSHVPGVINFRVSGMNNQILIKQLAPYMGLSTGSACSNLKPSRVLKEIGLNPKEISESIRISISPYTELSELDELEKILFSN